jgi:cell division protease FtsH
VSTSEVNGFVDLAATRRTDILDAALVRHGRLGRQIQVHANILDAALVRHGRLGRRIQDTEGKTDALEKYFAEELPALIAHCILKVHAKGKTMAQGIDLGPIARQTPSKSGADLAYLMNEGASIAECSNKSEMDQDDFANALERIPLAWRRKTRSGRRRRTSTISTTTSTTFTTTTASS